MKIPVAKLKDGENQYAFHSSSAGWLRNIAQDLEKEGYPVQGEISTTVTINKFEPDYFMKGTLNLKVQQCCARCAESFVMPVHHEFELGLIHLKDADSDTAVDSALAKAEDEQNLDVTYIENDEIDLRQILVEQFYLSLPFQVVCRENCQGICQQCGQNLNESKCNCKKSEVNHAFSILKDFKA